MKRARSTGPQTQVGEPVYAHPEHRYTYTSGGDCVLKRLILLMLVLALVAVGCGDNQAVVAPDGAGQTTLPGATTVGVGSPSTLPLPPATRPGGSGPLSPDEQALADAIGADAASEMGDELPIQGDQLSSCLGNAVVSALGAQRLAELGVTATDTSNLDAAFDQLTPAEQQAVLTAMIPCLDTPEVRDLLVQELVAGGMSQQSSECIIDAFLDPAVLGEIVALALSGDEEIDITENEEFLTTMIADLMGDS